MKLSWESLRLSGSIIPNNIKLQSKENSLFSSSTLPKGQEVSRFESFILQTPKRKKIQHLSVGFSPPSSVIADPDFGIGFIGENENIIGTDDRVRIQKPNKWPYCTTGLIQMEFPQGSGTGTGFLIGPSLVLTAGHCVYLPKYGGWVKNLRFAPGFQGTTLPFGYAEASKIWIQNQWKDSTNSEYDIALIQLNKTFTDNCGYYGFGYFSDNQLIDIEISISGYPADKEQARFQYAAQDKISRIINQRAYYYTDTFASQSGSAVLALDSLTDNPFTVVAVHTFGTPLENSGTRLTKSLVEDIVEIAQQS